MHTPSIYRLARAWVGEAAAPDVTQDVFLAAWQRLPQLRDPERFRPWLHRIAVNRCRTMLRARRPTITIGTLGASEPQSPDLRPGVEAAAVVAAAFAGLAADHRVLIGLHYAAGLSLREVAEVLGIPEGTAKSRLHAALIALRAKVLEPAR